MSEAPQRAVLVLSPYWAPTRVTGLWRPLRFCRYLQDFGWSPTILSPRSEDIFHHLPPQDKALSVPELPLIRPEVPLLSGRLCSQSARLGSAVDRLLDPLLPPQEEETQRRYPRRPGAFFEKSILRLIRRSQLPDPLSEWGISIARRLDQGALPELSALQGKVDAVWVTGGPFGAFVAGALIAERLRSALVLDYRDMWNCDHDTSHRPLFAPRSFVRAIERWALRRARAVSYIHQPCLEGNQRLFGQSEESRWEVIPNGFDSIDLGAAAPLRESTCNLLHAGNFYGSRSLRPCLEALEMLDDTAGVLRLETFGQIDRAALDWLAPRSLPEERFLHHPPVDAEEIGARLRGASALLLVIGETHREALSAKLYDYLAAGRPIIAYGPQDAAARPLIESLGAAGVWVESGDLDGLKRAYLDLIRGKLEAPEEPPQQLHARARARELAELLSWAAERGPL